MANTFIRQAIEGADDNTWAQYEVAQNKVAIEQITSYLINDSGTLKVTVGRIGIDNNTVAGVADIDTETTISLAGVTSGIWARVLMSVSGTTVTFSAVDIAGETDPLSFPTSIDAAWDGSRSGFYSTASRIIGVVYKNSAGDLALIVNTNKQFKNNQFQKVEKYAIFNSTTSFSTGATAGWQKVTIDNEELNEIDNMSLSSSVVSVPPGRYEITGFYNGRTNTASGAMSAGLRARDTTNSATAAKGAGKSFSASSGVTRDVFLSLQGVYSFDETTNIELQYYKETTLNAHDSSVGAALQSDTVCRQIMFKRLI